MPLFWFSLAVVIGIGLSSLITISALLLWVLFLASVIAGIFEIRFSRTHHHPLLSTQLFKIPLSFVIAGLLAGMLRFSSVLPANRQDDISNFTGAAVTVEGVVKADPYRAAHYTSITVACDQRIVGGHAAPVSGKLSAIIPASAGIEYGDRVALTGELETTYEEGSPPFTSRSGRRQVFSEMTFPEFIILDHYQGSAIMTALYRLRSRANVLLFDMIPYPESAVLSGIVLGIDTAIPDYLWNGYRASGTAHIIVISGFNISLIAFLLFKVLTKISRYEISIPLTIAAIILFTLLVGADQPVVRAALMAAIAFPAPYFGRKAVGIYSLTLAAAIMLLLNPFQLWDASFQLSFLATLSLLTVVDPVVNWISKRLNAGQDDENKERFKPIIELLISTASASFVVFPILFRMSGTISLVSLPANLLIVPLQPFIMVLGSLAVLIGTISPVLGGVFAKIAWPFLALCNQVALRFSVHPSATKQLPGWVYSLSLVGVVILLAFSSISQIVRLSKPQADNE